MERMLVLGASGMLGNAVFRLFASESDFTVHGTVRSISSAGELQREGATLLEGVDVGEFDTVVAAYAKARPTVVVNCVGVVKQLAQADDPLQVLPINSLLPHRLARLCAATGSSLVHVSTDCVFTGRIGRYREDDVPDALDLYGRSKLLGEVDAPHAVTLRTSIVGHEMRTAHGLVEWFLAQHGKVRGFTRAVFSGLPTVELARVIRDHVLPHPELHGVWHVSSAPISKHDLLRLVADAYGRSTMVEPDDALVIDRSLDSTRFRERTGFIPADWPTLVRRMKEFA